MDRILACDGSLYLPTAELRSPATRESADWGTYVHEYVRTRVVPPADKDHPTYPDRLRDRLDAAGDVLALWPVGGRNEVSFAYAIDTGEVISAELPTKKEEDAWKEAYDSRYVTGTADYLGSLLGRPWVDDLKTGRFPPSPSSAQTVFYALCAARLAGSTEGAYVTITHWPRYPVGCRPERVGRVLTPEDLDDFADLLEQRWRASPRALNPGEHCRFCPSRTNCPVFPGLEYLS